MSKPASAKAKASARPILRPDPVTRAAPREGFTVRALWTDSVQTAELGDVQRADHDDEGENGEDRGHGTLQLCQRL